MQCHQLSASGTHSSWDLLLSTQMTKKNNLKTKPHNNNNNKPQKLSDSSGRHFWTKVCALILVQISGSFFLSQKPHTWVQLWSAESRGWSRSSSCAICWEQLLLTLLLARGAEPALLVWQQTSLSKSSFHFCYLLLMLSTNLRREKCFGDWNPLSIVKQLQKTGTNCSCSRRCLQSLLWKVKPVVYQGRARVCPQSL